MVGEVDILILDTKFHILRKLIDKTLKNIFEIINNFSFDLISSGIMKHLAAYLLLELAGKTPNDKSIKSLLESVGIEADDNKIKKLLNELKDKNSEEDYRN
ncbi:16105_t:CDS:2 [Funneliformis mosseae]|uniref:16105_t:CDS:1 n=1 Tax=Funneliformis mosseae TaxID=27381 RepID=A0A9N9B2A0_FUNMO|nr:16105_t:CDS:2 [Funneliformis mosseae]